jgi:hypothetical protein
MLERRIMRKNGLEAPAIPRRREKIWAWALASLLLAGCGAEAYEKRLGNTKLLFAHMDLVNSNLQGTWSDPETGISLRAPSQLVVVPPPVKPAPDADAAKQKADAAAKGEAMEEEEEEEEIPDDRQPNYINLGLPGLRGAFKAPVKMISTGNAKAEGEAFMYVLSNHDLAENPEEAKEFKNEFIKNLTETLHVTFDPEKDSRDEKFPPGDPATNGFVTPVKYWNITVTSPEEIAGYVRIFSAYIHEKADMQVIVLFVLPADTDTSENFTKRIPLCLETLSVFGDHLSLPRKSGSAAGSAPASSF